MIYNHYYTFCCCVGLIEIDLSNAGTNVRGVIDMEVFDADGSFPYLTLIDLSDNPDLIINVNFSYLANTNIQYLDIRNTDTRGVVNFEYIPNGIELYLDTNIECEPKLGDCEDASLNDTHCTGREDCQSICACPEPKIAQIPFFSDVGTRRAVFGMLILMGIVSLYGTIVFNCRRRKICNCRQPIANSHEYNNSSSLQHVLSQLNLFFKS